MFIPVLLDILCFSERDDHSGCDALKTSQATKTWLKYGNFQVKM